MTLDDAIIHAEEKANVVCIKEDGTACNCAAEHAQLAEWLKELKEARQRIIDLERVIATPPPDDRSMLEQLRDGDYNYYEDKEEDYEAEELRWQARVNNTIREAKEKMSTTEEKEDFAWFCTECKQQVDIEVDDTQYADYVICRTESCSQKGDLERGQHASLKGEAATAHKNKYWSNND